MEEFYTRAILGFRRDNPALSNTDIILRCLVGIATEAGEVLASVQNYYKDKDTYPLTGEEFKNKITDELGDVMWYMWNLMGELGISMEDISEINRQKLTKRLMKGVS